MSLSDRQLRYLSAAGMLLVLLGTPLAVIYAIDFELVVMTGSPEVVAIVDYEALEPAARAAFRQSLDGRGPWYRTIGEAPFERLPVRVLYEGRPYTIGLVRRYHVGSIRGKLPLLTLALGLACLVVVRRDRNRTQGGLAVSRRT